MCDRSWTRSWRSAGDWQAAEKKVCLACRRGLRCPLASRLDRHDPVHDLGADRDAPWPGGSAADGSIRSTREVVLAISPRLAMLLGPAAPLRTVPSGQRANWSFRSPRGLRCPLARRLRWPTIPTARPASPTPSRPRSSPTVSGSRRSAPPRSRGIVTVAPLRASGPRSRAHTIPTIRAARESSRGASEANPIIRTGGEPAIPTRLLLRARI